MTCNIFAAWSIFTDSSPVTNLNFRANLNSFFEAPKGTECGNSLSANGLQLSQFPATAAAILQNTLSIFPQLRDKHQGPGENLQQDPQQKALSLPKAASFKNKIQISLGKSSYF